MNVPAVLASPKSVRQLLEARNLKPNKSLGQHFLVDRNVLDRIVRAIDPTSSDLILEIGAGLGVLTRELAPNCGAILAIEVDKGLAEILKDVVSPYGNARVLHQDFLKLDLARLPTVDGTEISPERLKVVGNLPYYISAPILVKLFTELRAWERFVLMLQREVALKLRAGPGSKDYGSLSILAQCHSDVSLVIPRISPRCFYPPPDVESAAAAFTPSPLRRKENAPDLSLMAEVVRSAFHYRRKTILNALEMGLNMSREESAKVLALAGIAEDRRPESLAIAEFAQLTEAILETGIKPDSCTSAPPTGRLFKIRPIN